MPLFAPDFDDLGSLSDGTPVHISDAIATSLSRPLLVPALVPPQSSHTPPTASIMTTNHRQHTGPAAMPAHRSRHAPYFSGKAHHSIKDFFREFEELAYDCGLTGRQKVEVIVRYVPSDLWDFWRSLAGFVTSDWTGLKRELLKIYDEPSTRHTKEKLRALVRRSAKERMRDEEDVQNFYREFLVLSKPLVDAHRLTTRERNKAFWRGFHKKDRQKMRARLVANNPQRVATEHVAYEDIYQVAKATFSGISLLAMSDQVRAWPGDTGGHKLGLNYAPGFVAQRTAAALGYQQLLWLLGETVAEAGEMNVFAVFERKDGGGCLSSSAGSHSPLHCLYATRSARCGHTPTRRHDITRRDARLGALTSLTYPTHRRSPSTPSQRPPTHGRTPTDDVRAFCGYRSWHTA